VLVSANFGVASLSSSMTDFFAWASPFGNVATCASVGEHALSTSLDASLPAPDELLTPLSAEHVMFARPFTEYYKQMCGRHVFSPHGKCCRSASTLRRRRAAHSSASSRASSQLSSGGGGGAGDDGVALSTVSSSLKSSSLPSREHPLPLVDDSRCDRRTDLVEYTYDTDFMLTVSYPQHFYVDPQMYPVDSHVWQHQSPVTRRDAHADLRDTASASMSTHP
jgi:hypothetical protein